MAGLQWLRRSPERHRGRPCEIGQIEDLALEPVNDRYAPFVPGSAVCIASIGMCLVLLTAEWARSFYRYLGLLERVGPSLFIFAGSHFLHQFLHSDAPIQQ
jgi:hypothetical protein